MGGSYERMTLLPLGGEENVWRRFADFDVTRATCYKEEERTKLLSALESGFGSYEAFNALVSNMFFAKSDDGVRGRMSFVSSHGGYEPMTEDRGGGGAWAA